MVLYGASPLYGIMGDASLPVVEVDGNPDWARDVGEAFHAYDGFCLLKPPQDVLDAYDDVMEAWDAFVALDAEQRNQYRAPEVGGEVGFNPLGSERNRLMGRETSEDEGNPNRYYHVGRDPAAVPEDLRDWFPVTPYPDEVDGFEDTMRDAYGELEGLSQEVLRGLTVYAEEETGEKMARAFNDYARYGNTILRMLDYPETEEVGDTARIGGHEDRGLITLLKTDDVAGLEVLTGDDPADPDDWMAVDNEPGQLVINIGEGMARLTNDFYPATKHRVRATTTERRRSIPFFVHASPHETLETEPAFLKEEPLNEEWRGRLDMDQYTLENINKRRRDTYDLPFLRPKEFHALNRAAREDGPAVYTDD